MEGSEPDWRSDEGRSESARGANEFQIATDLKRSTIQVAMCSSVAYSVLGVSLYPVVSGYEPNDFELDIVSGKSGHTVMPGDQDRPRVASWRAAPRDGIECCDPVVLTRECVTGMVDGAVSCYVCRPITCR